MSRKCWRLTLEVKYGRCAALLGAKSDRSGNLSHAIASGGGTLRESAGSTTPPSPTRCSQAGQRMRLREAALPVLPGNVPFGFDKNFTAKSAEIAKNCQVSPSRRSLRTDRAHLRGLPGECWAVRFSSQEVWARRLWASEAPPRRPGRILRESKKCRNFFCLSAKKVTHPDASIQAE